MDCVATSTIAWLPMETALFGTAAELKTQLDAGLDLNSKTPEGTTLLMMAAHDADKVKLLLSRGADARAKAKTGFTALMVATTYLGTSESVKLLLEHGAEVSRQARKLDSGARGKLLGSFMAQNIVRVLNAQSAAEAELTRAAAALSV